MDADLHIHTWFSDSTLSPKQVVTYAREMGLKAISICDHDIIDGAREAIEYASNSIKIIPGVELSAVAMQHEIHILGYFMDMNDSCFNERLEAFRKTRISRIFEMIKKLAAIGIKIDSKQIFEVAGKGSVGRVHVATVLCKENIVSSVQEAFNLYLGYNKPCYIKKTRISPEEAIRIIREAGGVPVLAHPGVSMCDEIIPELVRLGIKGIEAYHPMHPLPLWKHYEKLAKKYRLLITGGSDCHGTARGQMMIGTVRVAMDAVEKLRTEALP
ncbi:MAG: PHP domain-containing protein [bacterium]|nr:PHP domain-containing protein [bacterium]